MVELSISQAATNLYIKMGKPDLGFLKIFAHPKIAKELENSIIIKEKTIPIKYCDAIPEIENYNGAFISNIYLINTRIITEQDFLEGMKLENPNNRG